MVRKLPASPSILKCLVCYWQVRVYNRGRAWRKLLNHIEIKADQGESEHEKLKGYVTEKFWP